MKPSRLSCQVGQSVMSAHTWLPQRRALQCCQKLHCSASLQVVIDFDHTITGFRNPDGSKMVQCHDAIEHSQRMPDQLREDYQRLWEDQERGLTDGTWTWQQWWSRSHGLFVSHGLKRTWLVPIVAESGIRVRDHFLDFLKLLLEHHVPVLIVSAGITQIIAEVLRQNGVDPESVQICANEMVFNCEELLTHFTTPEITPDTKVDIGQLQQSYFARIGRKHVVVIGDSITDCDVIKKVPGVELMLLVGLYNVERGNWSAFKATFDMLLSNEALRPEEDLDFRPLIELMEVILGLRQDASDPFLQQVLAAGQSAKIAD